MSGCQNWALAMAQKVVVLDRGVPLEGLASASDRFEKCLISGQASQPPCLGWINHLCWLLLVHDWIRNEKD